MIFKLLTLLTLISNSYAQANISEIDERLTDIELKLIDRKLNVGMELQMFAGSVENENISNTDKTLRHTLFKNNLRLKINGVLNDNFKAYTSIQASYYFNDQVQTNINYSNRDTLSPEKGSTPYVRTAFFDWKLSNNFTFSAGRLPTTFGPPEHLKNGRQRLGTYPLSSFNLPVDGISLTYTGISSKDIAVTSRTIYAPGAITQTADPHEGEKLNSIDPTKYARGHEGFTQMLEAEYAKSNLLFNKINFISQFTYFKFGSFIEQTGPAQILSGAATSNKEDRNIYRIYADEKILSEIEILSLYLNIDKIFNSRFDLYFSFMHSENDPKATIKARVMTKASNTLGVNEGDDIALGKFITSKKETGNRGNIGAIYNFKNSLIGVEYYKTTGSPIPSDLYSDDFVRLGEIVGTTGHVYYTHMFYNRELSIRTGAAYVDEEMRFGTFAFESSRQNLQIFYTSMFVTF